MLFLKPYQPHLLHMEKKNAAIITLIYDKGFTLWVEPVSGLDLDCKLLIGDLCIEGVPNRDIL